MLVLKYFFYVGTLLSVLLYGWSEYLQPAGTKTQAAPSPAKIVVVFRPTPAPPVAEAEHRPSGRASEPPVVNETPNKAAAAAPAKSKKRKTQVARQRATAQRSFAYIPPRSFFFGQR